MGSYAIGIVVVTVGAAALGLVALPTAAVQWPSLALVTPDIVAALARRHVGETLILLYVVIVDVVATLETIRACSPDMCGSDGRLRNFDRGLSMSAVALGYVGYVITRYAVAALPADARDAPGAQLGRQLASLAVLLMMVTNSLALTIFALFVAYPVIAFKSGTRSRAGDMFAAAAGAAMILTVLR